MSSSKQESAGAGTNRRIEPERTRQRTGTLLVDPDFAPHRGVSGSPEQGFVPTLDEARHICRTPTGTGKHL